VVIGWMTDGYEVEMGDTYFHLYSIIQELEPFFGGEAGLGFLGGLIFSVVDFVKDDANQIENPVNCARIIRLLK